MLQGYPIDVASKLLQGLRRCSIFRTSRKPPTLTARPNNSYSVSSWKHTRTHVARPPGPSQPRGPLTPVIKKKPPTAAFTHDTENMPTRASLHTTGTVIENKLSLQPARYCRVTSAP